MNNKPTIFIGSSTAALPIVDVFIEALKSHVNCVPWNQAGQFNSEGTNTTFEALRSAALQYDFALFVICPDDKLFLMGEGEELWSVRDNVVFEVGLFLGSLGNDRVFLARQSTPHVQRIPTDLLGTSMPSFQWNKHDRVSSLASINSMSLGIKGAIEKRSFLQFHLRLASGWGRESDPDRFEVKLEGARLAEQMHLVQGKNVAVVARLESLTTNFEDDPNIVFSEARQSPTPLSDMVFQIPIEKFGRTPVPKKDRFQSRVILTPPDMDLSRFSCLKEAQSQGCRIVEPMSCAVKPLAKRRPRKVRK